MATKKKKTPKAIIKERLVELRAEKHNDGTADYFRVQGRVRELENLLILL